MMILTWGIGMTGQAHLRPWRIAKTPKGMIHLPWLFIHSSNIWPSQEALLRQLQP